MRGLGAVAWVVCVACVCAATSADEVHLHDGSLVRGTITGIAEGIVTIETEFAGAIEIPLEKIGGITTEDAQGVKLDTGEILLGRLDYTNGKQRLVLDDDAMSIEADRLEGIGDPDDLLNPKTVNWSGRVELGITGDTGNTEEFQARGRVQTIRESEVDRLTLYLRGEYGEANGVKTDNEVLGGVRYERDLTGRLFAFARQEAEFDEFENLDLRLTVSSGLGYFLLRSERQDLKARAGLAYKHEAFDDGSTNDGVLGEAGYDYRLDVWKRLHFLSTFTYNTNFLDFGDWEADAENSLEIPISPHEAWKLRLGVRNEYDSDPKPGVQNLDTSYYTSLVYVWE